ncbi:TIR domain-containing protein, partial [Meloidogyne graminicola]
STSNNIIINNLNNKNCYSSLEIKKIDIFICYAKIDELEILDLWTKLNNLGYKIHLLQKCKYYTSENINISDPLNNLIKESKLLILYISCNFIIEYLNISQLSTGIQLFKNKIFTIFSNEMNENDINLIPQKLGKIIRRKGTSRLNDPCFWDKLERYLPNNNRQQQQQEQQLNYSNNEYEQITTNNQSNFV